MAICRCKRALRLILCVGTFFFIADALETKLEYQYYDVDLSEFPNLKEDMASHAQLSNQFSSHKVVADYEASVSIKNIALKYDSGVCYLNQFELILNGVITLPRLRHQQYAFRFRHGFEQEVVTLEAHELTHQKIWQNHLRHYENAIMALKIEDDENCHQLFNIINEKMIVVLAEISKENQLFDCSAYGEALKLSQCQ